MALDSNGFISGSHQMASHSSEISKGILNAPKGLAVVKMLYMQRI
jgi:hypothetical protein